MELYGGAPVAESVARTIMAFGGILLFLLSARIIVIRLYRRWRRLPPYAGVAPTVAYLAYGLMALMPARNGLRRIPDGQSLDWTSTIVYIVALALGFAAVAQIMYVKRPHRARDPEG